MKWARTFGVLAVVVRRPRRRPPRSSAQRQPKQYTIEQFLDTTSISGASFSADESRILFSSNKTGIWNAYTVPVAGGPWTPITSSTTDSTYAVGLLSSRRSHPAHARPGRQRAESSLRPDAGRRRARHHAGRQAQGAVPGLDPRRRRLLREQQRTGPEVLRHLSLRREDVRPDALLREQRRLFSGHRLRRRQVGVADEGQHDERQRHVPVECRREDDDAGVGAQGGGELRSDGVRSRVEIPLLRDQRHGRVLTAAPLRARDETARRRLQDGLGRHLDDHVPQRPVPRHRRQRGRASADHRQRHDDEPPGRAAGDSQRRRQLRRVRAQREEGGAPCERRPLAGQSLRPRSRRRGNRRG